MSDRKRTSQHYEKLLRRLKDRLLVMSSKSELMIRDSIRALVERSPSLAREVIRRDDEIDRMEIEIDELCLEIMALEQPVASDLRFLTTAFKIVRDLERIGDVGVNIAERVEELMQEPELKPLIDLPVMARTVEKILRDSFDAFVNSDASLGEQVVKDDEQLDHMYEQIFRELLTYMLEDPKSISRALKLIFIAKGLERVGDHCANIGEMVVFLVKGQDIRHGKSSDS